MNPSTLKSPEQSLALLPEDVIAPAHLAELRGDPGSLPELIATFKREGATNLEGIRSAISSRDPEELVRHAHRLNGAAGSLGGRSLSALCAKLETIGRSGTVCGAAALRRDVETQYAALLAALEMVAGDAA